MKQTIYLNDGSVYEAGSLPQPPEEDVWYYIKSDFQMPTNWDSYPIRDKAIQLGGAPAVFIFNDDGVHLTKEWQYFIASLMSLSRYNKLWTPKGSGDLTTDERTVIEKCFQGTLGDRVAFCNRSGLPGRANYVTMTDLDKELPKYDKMRTCGSNSHKGFETTDNKGKSVVQVDSFIWEDGPPTNFDRSILSDPRIFWATVIRDNKISDDPPIYPINRFPRLDGGDVPLPLIRKRNNQPLQYPMSYVEKYTGARRPIYWPPSGEPWK